MGRVLTPHRDRQRLVRWHHQGSDAGDRRRIRTGAGLPGPRPPQSREAFVEYRVDSGARGRGRRHRGIRESTGPGGIGRQRSASDTCGSAVCTTWRSVHDESLSAGDRAG